MIRIKVPIPEWWNVCDTSALASPPVLGRPSSSEAQIAVPTSQDPASILLTPQVWERLGIVATPHEDTYHLAVNEPTF
jgi:hypothetical protein